MSRAERLAFALVLLAATFTASIDARRSFSSRGSSRPSHHYTPSRNYPQSHNYPPSHGNSGSNSHNYPPSGGYSGTGSRGSQSHSYPPSAGISGNSPGHTSAGGVHQPHTPTHVSNVHATHGQANGHSYPPSTSLSGNNRGTPGGGSNVHYHQHVYQAPQQIHYTPVHGAAPMQPYPVYHGQPPVYIHEIRDSGSRYSTLLTGLALYNLGRSTSGSNHHHYQTQNNGLNGQTPDNGERCTLRIEQDRNLEKVKIPCYIVSTFKDTSDLNSALSTSTTTSTAAPVSTSAVPETTAASVTTTIAPMFNGTALNATIAVNATSAVNGTGQTNITMATEAHNATVTIQNVPVVQNSTITAPNVPVRNGSDPVDAVKVKGEPLQLKKEARCFVETVTRTRTSVKEIECGLLQQYALQSMQRQQPQRHRNNSASNVAVSAFTLLAVTVLKYIVY